MRTRAPAALFAAVLICALAPAIAQAAKGEHLEAYKATVDEIAAAALAAEGVDLEHVGYRPGEAVEQRLEVDLFPSQAEKLEAKGIDLRQVQLRTAEKTETGGDSPNPYYDVYRSYMEPGGILDEMRQIARDHRDVVKPMIVGHSLLGKPIIVLKITADARNTPDGTRPAVLYSSNNHAREWLAAETERRLVNWFVDHKNDHRIRELLETRELWFMPIQNPDGYDYTFTCGLGDENEMCGPGHPVYDEGEEDNRLWRKSLRDNNGNGIYGDDFDGVDPNRNYPAKRGIDEEGASNNFRSGTYRGPYALSEPENLAFDRLLRKVDFAANVNYHTAAQLLLTPVSYITDYAPVDATLFNAMTGVDGDSAVDPYTPQRSSDLYESNGDTIDGAYMNYGVIGWTPELDTRATGGGGSGSSFIYPDDEGKVQAVFEKNLPMALNIAHSADDLGRPQNFEHDPSRYVVKPTQDIDINEFDVSYGREQVVEAIVRRSLGPVDMEVEVSSPEGSDRDDSDTLLVRMEEAPAGERYGDAPGVYFKRVRATVPALMPPGDDDDPPRQTEAGDVVDVTIRAGGLARELSYRVESVQQDESKDRVLVVAAEDYTGTSPNVEPGYDVAPRYLDEHVEAIEAAGYQVDTFNVDAPPQNAGGPATKHPTFLGVLSHFDAVLYYTGDDFIPQGITETDPRRLTDEDSTTGSDDIADWAHKAMLAMRDYMNEGGKLIVDGRNAHQPFTSSSLSLSATGPYDWAPDQQFGFYYPPDNGGDDHLVGTAFRRFRSVSNDTWQNYFGVIGRDGGYGDPEFAAASVEIVPDGLFAGMGPIVVNQGSGNDPNQDANGVANPQAKHLTWLATWSGESVQEPFRQESLELGISQANDDENPQEGGAAVSTGDTVTFGFGLEQVDEDTRNELVARSLAHLLPTAADTTAPLVRFKFPVDDNWVATPLDPVEVDVTAADERLDMKEVRLYADGELVGTFGTFPFQFRWQPTAEDAGSTVTLTAEAEDKAGNVATATRQVRVVAAEAMVEAPLPVRESPPTIEGDPVYRRTLTCLPGGFLNEPDELRYEWLRNGVAIAGAGEQTYTTGSSDIGRQLRCRVTAVNEAGDADATSDFVVVSAGPPWGGGPTAQAGPQGLAGPTGPTGATGPQGPAGPAALVTCDLSRSRKTVTCVTEAVGSTSSRVKTTIRLAGTKKKATRSSRRGRVTVRLRDGGRRIRSGRKVVVRVSVGRSKARTAVRVTKRERRSELSLSKRGR